MALLGGLGWRKRWRQDGGANFLRKYVMSEEEFLLKWNNHQSNFVDVFNELLQDESFVDVTLVCGGEAVPGHKMVLAACSPLLHRILRDNPCRHPLVILGDVPAGDMRAIMHFIYQGEVSVSQSELASFLKTADNLQIKGLAENRESGKEDRKRKDKDGERLEGRPNNKRQRTSEGRLDTANAAAAPATSPVSSRSHKSLSDSHSSSHKGRGGGNRATGDEQHHQGLRSSSSTSGRGSASNSTTNHHHNHHPASKHHHTLSSKHSSSKASHAQDIPSKVSSSSTKHRVEEGVSTSHHHHHHHHHHNSENSVGEDRMLAKEELDDLTVKTEPLDYPGEVAWSEGAGGLTREAGMEDSQGLLPITASMPGGLEGVAAAIVASPNLPIIEFELENLAGDDSRNDDGSRGDLSTASDDVNVNNTAGTQVQDRHTQGSAGVPGAVVRSTLGHPPLQMQKQPHHHPHHNQHDPPHSKIQPGGGAQSFPGLHSVPLPIPSCTLPPTPGSVASPNPPPPSSALPLITTITSSSNTSSSTSSGSHNNNNVHKCQQCPFLTSNPYTFTRHLRIHLGTKEFRCRLCGFATSRKDSLIRHFRMKHLTGEMSVYHDLDSRDIEELAMARVIPEGLQIFAGKL